MRIALAHNFYQISGGEDAVFKTEQALLQRRGFTVFTYTVHNNAIKGIWGRMLAFLAAIWNQKHYVGMREFLRNNQVDILHVHNFFPVLSPAIFWAAKREGVPTVWTTHNYRLGCLNALYLRDGRICQLCQGRKWKWPGVRYGCYRGRLGSLAVALSIGLHHRCGTWTRCISHYLALTDFGKAQLVAEGVPAEKITVKPNTAYPEPGTAGESQNYFVYIGRLSAEKGLESLIAAWSELPHEYELRILGAGPLLDSLQRKTEGQKNIRLLGHTDPAGHLQHAKALIFPSICFEGFPVAIAEAFLAGLPVLASNLGAMQSIVREQENGLLFAPGNPTAIAAAVRKLAGSPELESQLRQGAKESGAAYSSERNIGELETIYRQLSNPAISV